MSEETLEKVDEFLFQLVQARFEKVIKFAVLGKRRFSDLLMLLVKAFVRCLYYTKGEIFLKDIAIISRAEALFMLNEPLYSMNFKAVSTFLYTEQMENILDNEMHRWILFLAENNKLPPGSEYHRFMGKYIKN